MPSTSGLEATLEIMSTKLQKLEKLDSIEDNMKKLVEDMHALKSRVGTLEQDQREMERSMQYQMEDIDEICRELRNVNNGTDLLEMSGGIEQRLDKLENEMRKKNLIVLGAPESVEVEMGGSVNFFRHLTTAVEKITSNQKK